MKDECEFRCMAVAGRILGDKKVTFLVTFGVRSNGQLISKCLFDVSKFFQKNNEKKSP